MRHVLACRLVLRMRQHNASIVLQRIVRGCLAIKFVVELKRTNAIHERIKHIKAKKVQIAYANHLRHIAAVKICSFLWCKKASYRMFLRKAIKQYAFGWKARTAYHSELGNLCKIEIQRHALETSHVQDVVQQKIHAFELYLTTASGKEEVRQATTNLKLQIQHEENHLKAMRLSSDKHKEAEAKLVFNRFDFDGSGSMDAHEIQLLFEELGIVLTSHELKDTMEQLDTDGDGEIDFNEFFVWYHESEINHSRQKHQDNKTKTLLAFKKIGMSGKKALENMAHVGGVSKLAHRKLLFNESKKAHHDATVAYRVTSSPNFECKECLCAFGRYLNYWKHTHYTCTIAREGEDSNAEDLRLALENAHVQQVCEMAESEFMDHISSKFGKNCIKNEIKRLAVLEAAVPQDPISKATYAFETYDLDGSGSIDRYVFGLTVVAF